MGAANVALSNTPVVASLNDTTRLQKCQEKSELNSAQVR